MMLYIGLLIAAIAATASASYFPSTESPEDEVAAQFAYQLKTFRQVVDECAEYLQVSQESVENLVAYNYVTEDPTLKCLVRCAGVNAGWWSVRGNNTGLRCPVLESYFQPACDDTCYAKRTQECLDSKVTKCQDDCSKAYESFLCYYHQYGNLKDSEEYVPVPNPDAVQAAVDCMLLLRTPKELLEQYSQGVFPNVPETQCLYRCQYLAEGLYDGKTYNLTRFYVREYYTPSPGYLLPETQACVDSALKAACDECAGVNNARLTCIDDLGNPDHSAELFKAAAALVLAQRTCEDEDLSPKYNAGTPEPPCATTTTTPAPTPCPSANTTPAPAPAPGCKYNCGS